MPSPNQITVEQLNQLIGTPECPVLVDVCIDQDFNEDPRLIPTAFRHPFSQLHELIPRLENRKVVVICQKGLKLSAGACAILRAEGIESRYLEGGNFAWRDSDAPFMPVEKIPPFSSFGCTLWVTHHRPAVGQIACTWLIRRFIDPNARFLFVTSQDVLQVAEKYKAVALDIEYTVGSQVENHGSFDRMISEFQLSIPALMKLAHIIRAADTGRQDSAREAAGLLAMTSGLSRICGDDLEYLEAGMMLFDALYRWVRDVRDEAHGSLKENGTGTTT